MQSSAEYPANYFYHPLLDLAVVQTRKCKYSDWPAEGAFTFLKRIISLLYTVRE